MTSSWPRNSFLGMLLLTPPGKTTRIDRKHYDVISDYLSPGDRIVWHRPYGMMHTSIVVGVDDVKGGFIALERNTTENDCIKVALNWIHLKSQYGKLYRCDDDLEMIPISAKLRIILNKIGEKGFNILGRNCQTLVGNDSFQTKWLGINMLLQALKSVGLKAVSSELIEALLGGSERIGVVTVIAMQVVAFVMEFHVACEKLKAGDISWKHFTELIIRQFSMAVGSSLGSALGGGYLVTVMNPKMILWLVLSLVGAIVADALLIEWIGPESQYRYLGLMAGGILGFTCCCISPGFVLEMLMSCLFGFAGLLIGHVAGYNASSLFTGNDADCRVVNELRDLKKGDHIANYEWFLHPYCHALFVKAMPNGRYMKIIRNTYQRGVVEEVVLFNSGSVYRYEYHESECYVGTRVVENARSELGKCNYSLFSNSCKTFAKRCKCKSHDHDEPDAMRPRVPEEIDCDQLLAEMISDPILLESRINDLEKMFQTIKRKGSFLLAG